MLEITGATLLSTEEAKQLDTKILKTSCDWWLRSPGYIDELAALVSGDDDYIYGNGHDVRHSFGVRPALEISNPEGAGLQIGDRFAFGYYNFTVISNKHALCNEIVWESFFEKIGKIGKQKMRMIMKSLM